jgi:hypothetical protein
MSGECDLAELLARKEALVGFLTSLETDPEKRKRWREELEKVETDLNVMLKDWTDYG